MQANSMKKASGTMVPLAFPECGPSRARDKLTPRLQRIC